MAVCDQLLVVRVIDEHHLVEGRRPVVRIKTRLAGYRTAFLKLLGLAHRFARDARDDDHHGDRCQKTHIF